MRYFIVAALFCAGCSDLISYPEPSPAQVQLQFMCNQGDAQACSTVLAAEQNEQARQTAALGMVMANNNAMMQSNAMLWGHPGYGY